MQQPRTVLVVDDEVIIAMAGESVLEAGGHRPVVATGMAQALEIAGRLPRLDAAVVDLQLTDGSGAQLIAALRALRPGLPVVISTGYALDAEERAALNPALGRTVVLKKPWSEAQLLEAVDSATRTPPEPRRAPGPPQPAA